MSLSAAHVLYELECGCLLGSTAPSVFLTVDFKD